MGTVLLGRGEPPPAVKPKERRDWEREVWRWPQAFGSGSRTSVATPTCQRAWGSAAWSLGQERLTLIGQWPLSFSTMRGRSVNLGGSEMRFVLTPGGRSRAVGERREVGRVSDHLGPHPLALAPNPSPGLTQVCLSDDFSQATLSPPAPCSFRSELLCCWP